MQDSQANCGPYALKNALAALGIERTAGELESACKTSATDGTSLRKIFAAAGKIEGCYPVTLREKRSDVALLKLSEALRRGRPVVIAWCTNNPGDHWVAVVGMLGDRYLVADSAHNELVITYTTGELINRWADGSYEGVVL